MWVCLGSEEFIACVVGLAKSCDKAKVWGNFVVLDNAHEDQDALVGEVRD